MIYKEIGTNFSISASVWVAIKRSNAVRIFLWRVCSHHLLLAQTPHSYGEFATIDLIDTNFHNFYGEFDPGSE